MVGVLEWRLGTEVGRGSEPRVSKGCGSLGPPGFPWRRMLGLRRDRQHAQSPSFKRRPGWGQQV